MNLVEMVSVAGYILVWFSLSCGMILFNKWLLYYLHFPFPMTLSFCHMVTASLLSFLLCRVFNVYAVPSISMHDYLRKLLPIGVCYTGSILLSNQVYLYLSVSFIQMLKAMTPVVVMLLSFALGLQKPSLELVVSIVSISSGVAVASYGEVTLVWIGVIIQVVALTIEATRLSLIQILLQGSSIKLDAMTTLLYVAPFAAVLMGGAVCYFELPELIKPDFKTDMQPWQLLLNCLISFGLNLASMQLIAKTSSLTLTVSGVVKDWFLIGLSAVLFATIPSLTSLLAYGAAFAGLCFYVYLKAPPSSSSSSLEDPKSSSLLTHLCTSTAIMAFSTTLIVMAVRAHLASSPVNLDSN